MSLFVIITVLSFLLTCDCFFWPPKTHIKTCIPTFHAWQPMFGCVPPKSYIAGVDQDGEKKYVARVVSPDSKSWSAPTTLSGKTLVLYYNWGGKKGGNVAKVVEVLTVKNPHNGFGWRKTSKLYLKDLSKDCCLVEGGSGYQNKEKIVSWVGRTMNHGKFYIGGVREAEWNIFNIKHPMRYLDESGTTHGISDPFEVLAYDCCSKFQCLKPNKADCCFDILD